MTMRLVPYIRKVKLSISVLVALFTGLSILMCAMDTLAQRTTDSSAVAEKQVSNLQIRLREQMDSLAKLQKGQLDTALVRKMHKIQATFSNQVDSLRKRPSQLIDTTGKKLSGLAKSKKDQVLSGTKDEINRTKAEINAKVAKLKTPVVSYRLTASNAGRYQPVSAAGGQDLINNLGLTGTFQAFGIPLSLNATNSQGHVNGLGSFNRNLFKVGFNQGGFQELVKADLLRYSNFKDRFLSGYELGDHLKEQVYKDLQGTLRPGAYTQISSYIEQPEHLRQLLSFNRDDLKAKVMALADQNMPDSLREVSRLLRANGEIRNTALEEQVKNKVMAKLREDTSSLINLIATHASIDSVRAMAIAQLQRSLNSTADTTTRDSIQRAIAVINRSNDTKEIRDQTVDRIKRSAGTNLMGQLLTAGNDAKTIQQIDPKRVESFYKLQQLRSLKADTVVAHITRLKETLSKNGLDVNRVLLLEKYLSGAKVNSSSINDLLGQYPDNRVQQFFTRIDDIRVGSYGNRLPAGVQNSDRFVEGTHLGIRLGNTPFTFGYGAIKDIASAKDAAYQNSVYQTPQNVSYLSAFVNKSRGGSVKLSVISSFSGRFNDLAYNTPTLPSNAVTFTATKAFNMGNAGDLTIDLSKSATLYARNYQQGAEGLVERKAGYTEGLGNDIFGALAFGMNHHAEVPSVGLSETFYASYADMGYQNPANSGYTGGKRKIGGNLKKRFWKNKFTVGVRGDLRDMPLSYTSADKWRNYQVQVDTRYQFTKKMDINLRFTNAATDKRLEGLSTTVYSSRKMQVDLNNSFKIGKHFSVAHLSVGQQTLSNNYLSKENSDMLTFNYLQSVVFPGSSLTATVFYNRELTGYQLIGDLLNADLSYQYLLFKKLTLTSALTGLDNQRIARQVGLRQGIQLLSANGFEVDTFIDLRKNMITPLYPDLYASCRGELQLRYTFNSDKK